MEGKGGEWGGDGKVLNERVRFGCTWKVEEGWRELGRGRNGKGW